MKQIHIRINKSFSFDTHSLSELVTCEKRLANLYKDHYFSSLAIPKFKNMLEILNYIEEDKPKEVTNEYIKKSF